MLVGVCSDVGKIREINQDAYFCSEGHELPLYVVADGMGGQKAGEVASFIAIETIKSELEKNKSRLLQRELEVPKFINDTLKKANYAIYFKAKEKEACYGMGTTVTMACFRGNELYIGHVGDSRAYLYNDDTFIQLTQDHSLVAELVRNGSITKAEAKAHPQKHIITRALGTDDEIKVDIFSRRVQKDDGVILCTDGLTNMVSDKRIKAIIQEAETLQAACIKLTNTANELGGPDNTTVLIIKND